MSISFNPHNESEDILFNNNSTNLKLQKEIDSLIKELKSEILWCTIDQDKV